MSSWRDFFEAELHEPYLVELRAFLVNERKTAQVFPPSESVFRAFESTPLDQVKVVILGQDPYHGPGQAMGLSFSVPANVRPPPSLHNIYEEVERDTGTCSAKGGDLTPWAKQGVLLLNTLLTVRRQEPLSHQNRGWERFTDRAIAFLLEHHQPAFLLWGAPAQKKLESALKRTSGFKASSDACLILKAPHPSPLSAHRGFVGCGHFSKVNKWLEERGQSPIVW